MKLFPTLSDVVKVTFVKHAFYSMNAFLISELMFANNVNNNPNILIVIYLTMKFLKKEVYISRIEIITEVRTNYSSSFFV